MGKILFLTCPEWDNGTQYLSRYSTLIIQQAKKLNIEYKAFYKDEAIPEKTTKYLIKKQPSLIFINGHGDEKSLEGDKDKILFSVDKNLNLLKNKITYARACNAGNLLGKKIAEKGKTCFIGYKSPFSFWIDNKRCSTPLKDKIASLFLLPSNEIIISLLKGKTAKQANEISKKMMVKNMLKIVKMNEKKEPGAMAWLSLLWNNYSGQVLLGEDNLKFN